MEHNHAPQTRLDLICLRLTINYLTNLSKSIILNMVIHLNITHDSYFAGSPRLVHPQPVPITQGEKGASRGHRLDHDSSLKLV